MEGRRETDRQRYGTTVIVSHILPHVLFLLYPALLGAAGALLVL